MTTSVSTTVQAPSGTERDPDDYLVQYERYDLEDPKRWAFFVSPSNETVSRLVVFVHGFGGKTVKTWLDFPEIDLARAENDWWRESDLLFVGYSTRRDSITSVANRIRKELPRFYPTPYEPALVVDSEQIRPDITSDYSELVLVGHSLGGVILRRALCDAAKSPSTPQSQMLLSAQTRLFSPAHAGFRAAGWLGFLKATSFWYGLDPFLRRCSAYSDLQPESKVLSRLRSQTMRLVEEDSEGKSPALKAAVVWACPEDVVADEDYETDHPSDSWDGFTHTSLCKPQRRRFMRPWEFVQTGEG
ncbi:esterase/lipase family protein [Mycolicibacterium sp.]|uniref:esterase/lipase family protein n=1 Tax=Mycolicibacterium sp. TaxID=2320850 RepID=UPI0037CBC77A